MVGTSVGSLVGDSEEGVIVVGAIVLGDLEGDEVGIAVVGECEVGATDVGVKVVGEAVGEAVMACNSTESTANNVSL